jgi:protein-S-isoprenylcysteine O-methyltransferase Ste14
MHSKTSSPIEVLRKPVSRLTAALIVVVAVFTVPMIFETNLGEFMELSGFGLLIVAALGRIWCSIYISGRKDRILCQEGPYSLTRNPLYFFSFLGVIGFSAALQSVAVLVFSSVFYLIYYHFVIRSEEIRLQELFGAPYLAYSSVTPRFFPAFRTFPCIEQYTINPRIMERALREVIWFLLAILVLEILEWLHHNGYLILAQTPF